jgi:hypothetical protein
MISNSAHLIGAGQTRPSAHENSITSSTVSILTPICLEAQKSPYLGSQIGVLLSATTRLLDGVLFCVLRDFVTGHSDQINIQLIS